MAPSVIRFYLYIGMVFFAALCGLYRRSRLDTASKLICGVLSLTFASELMAHFAALRYRNNMFVYHFFAPSQFALIALYFNYSIEYFRKRYIGICVGLIGLLLGVLNSATLQSLKTLNSHFLLFEGFCIISMALYSFYYILEDDKIDAYKYPHFWFSTILLFFWSITYTSWALYSVVGAQRMHLLSFIVPILWFVNIVSYSGIAAVFLFYPKELK